MIQILFIYRGEPPATPTGGGAYILATEEY